MPNPKKLARQLLPKKLARQLLPKKLIKTLEVIYRESRGWFWRAYYIFPGDNQKVIAITGTNGKTTTAAYTAEVLKALGKTVAVYTTAFTEIDGQRQPSLSQLTITSQRDVQSFFVKARRAKVDYVVLEITSMALDQRRVVGYKAEVAVVTNLTQDHLDYHKTMENYASAKARLLSREYQTKHAVLNADDDWFKFFASKTQAKKLAYGKTTDSDLKLIKYQASDNGSNFNFEYKKQQYSASTKLVGLFNIYNALAAIGVALALGLDPKKAAEGVTQLDYVPGRMESIDEGQNFKVLVDFAITPDALKNALQTVQQFTKGKVRVVFGATGDRDKSKRPIMGEVVAKYADAIYLTDDETYTENPQAIRDQVYVGIKNAKAASKTRVIDDRLQAIRTAFIDSKKGDTVLLAGIGHEQYRNMGGKKIPWDEREVARRELQ